MKVLLIVIDGFGIGAMPDADKFGDVGSKTYLNTLVFANLNDTDMLYSYKNNPVGYTKWF